jgi:hypothetical protein
MANISGYPSIAIPAKAEIQGWGRDNTQLRNFAISEINENLT